MKTVRVGDAYTTTMDQEERLYLISALAIAKSTACEKYAYYYNKATLRKTKDSEMYMDWAKECDNEFKAFVKLSNDLGRIERK